MCGFCDSVIHASCDWMISWL